MPADNPDGKKNKNKDRKVLLILAIAALLFTFALNYFIGKRNSASVSEVKYSEFITMLDEGKFE